MNGTVGIPGAVRQFGLLISSSGPRPSVFFGLISFRELESSRYVRKGRRSRRRASRR